MARDPKANLDSAYETESYDEGNTFAQILRGEIEVEPVYQSEHALAFPDTTPRAKHHVLVVPKGQYTSLHDFVERAPAEQVKGFWQAVAATTRKLGLHEIGYRLVINQGDDAGQTVPHFGVHVLGGEALGPMRCDHVEVEPAQLAPRRAGVRRSKLEGPREDLATPGERLYGAKK